MTRVVVTRSAEDVDRLAERLAAAGHLPVKLPLLAIEPTHSLPAIDDVPLANTAVIYTSVNAVRHGFEEVAKAITGEGPAIIAVGAKTREELLKKGFAQNLPCEKTQRAYLPC